jgi:transmembrane sensor
MADVHHLPDEQQVLREASEWIARLKAEDVTAEDRSNFAAWRSAHPLHSRTFDDLELTWSRFAAARPVVRAVAFGQSMNDTATRVVAEKARARSRWRHAAWAAVAAGILSGVGWFAYIHGNPMGTYLTAIGEHATVSLLDGSTLQLDSDSRARVDFSKQYRVVYLERGEAFFKVAHDVQRPFWVVGAGSWVRAVGTAFNVSLGVTGMRVTVSEGIVKVGAVTPLLQDIPFADALLDHVPALSVLTAGHEADLHGSAVAIRPLTPAQLARAVSWRAGTLYFENQQLSEVVETLGRYTPLHLVITDPSLRELPVAGTFDANPRGVDAFLAMLHQGFGLTVHREADKVVIEPASGTPR